MKLLLIVTSIMAITPAYQRRTRNMFSFPDNKFTFHPPWFTGHTTGPPEPEPIPRVQPGPPGSNPRSFEQPRPPCSNQEPGQSEGYLPPGPAENPGSFVRFIPPIYGPVWNRPTTPTNRPPKYPNYPPHARPTTQRTTTTRADLMKYVEACVAGCPMVGDYEPVCGTDNVIYANIEKLECAKLCGVDVELSSSNSCQPQKPVINIPDVISACISTCSVTTEYSPVCGTDNVTYQNLGRFECAKNCGREIEVSRMSSCLVPPGPDNPDLRLTTTTTESPKINENGDNNEDSRNNGDRNCNANGGNVKKPSMTELIACMQLCPMTTEVNPVCGTDGVTYTNPGKLLCTQFCGVDVKVQKFSTCSGEPLPTAQPACPCPLPLTPPTTEECFRRCSVSQELKPVCGSDGVTYINLASLQCKIGCGVDVSVQKLSPCGEASTNPPTTPSWNNTDRTTEPTVTPTTPGNVQTCIDKCYVTPEHKPVCGTNGQTYVSLARLRCAKQCGINVDVKKLTACDVTEPDPSITISPDVLASIFPEDFKSTTPKDSGEDYDIDQRFGD